MLAYNFIQLPCKAVNMFTHYLRHSYLLFILLSLLSLPFLSYANAYKWKDENKTVHYTEQAPRGVEYEIIGAPPPPATAPEVAQKEIDSLIETSKATDEEQEQERLLVKEAEEKKKQKEDLCAAVRHNLMQYQNNPGRRMIDEHGNIIPPNEEHRQQKIAELEKEIIETCE